MEFFQDHRTVFISLHILGVVIGMGAALFSDVVFSFFGRDKVLTSGEVKNLSIFSNIVWLGLLIIIISGAGIFLSNPEKYLHSVKFLSKMTAVLVLTLNGLVLYKFVQPYLKHTDFLTAARDKNRRSLAFTCGAVSVISWVTAFTLALFESVPFSYPQFIFGYLIVLLIGVSIALFVEGKSSRTK